MDIVLANATRAFVARGDLAHLALLLWAVSVTGCLWFALRELAACIPSCRLSFGSPATPARKNG